MVTASVGRRMLGQVVNVVIPFIVIVGLTSSARDTDRFWLYYLVAGPGYLLLQIALLHLVGGHPGHLLLGMRAVTPTGRPSVGQAAVRVAVYIALPLYLLQLTLLAPWARMLQLAWTIVLLVVLVQDPQKRSIHDRLAGTTVVRV